MFSLEPDWGLWIFAVMGEWGNTDFGSHGFFVGFNVSGYVAISPANLIFFFLLEVFVLYLMPLMALNLIC